MRVQRHGMFRDLLASVIALLVQQDGEVVPRLWIAGCHRAGLAGGFDRGTRLPRRHNNLAR
ncbi:MAG: hypothetical protein WDN04_13590 [Rhodospirillales bacterium]